MCGASLHSPVHSSALRESKDIDKATAVRRHLWRDEKSNERVIRKEEKRRDEGEKKIERE